MWLSYSKQLSSLRHQKTSFASLEAHWKQLRCSSEFINSVKHGILLCSSEAFHLETKGLQGRGNISAFFKICSTKVLDARRPSKTNTVSFFFCPFLFLFGVTVAPSQTVGGKRCAVQTQGGRRTEEHKMRHFRVTVSETQALDTSPVKYSPRCMNLSEVCLFQTKPSRLRWNTNSGGPRGPHLPAAALA